MIAGYRDKRTHDLADGKRVRAFDGIARKGQHGIPINDPPGGSPGPTEVAIGDDD